MRDYKIQLPKRLMTSGGPDLVDLEPVIKSIAKDSLSFTIDPFAPYNVDLKAFVDTVDGLSAVGLTASDTINSQWASLAIQSESGNPPYATMEASSSAGGNSIMYVYPTNIYMRSEAGGNAASFVVSSNGGINASLSGTAAFVIDDQRDGSYGITYLSDYSTSIKANNRSLPDVGTVKILRQQANTWTTGGRPTQVAGTWGFNTTTGKFEGTDGTTWSNFN